MTDEVNPELEVSVLPQTVPDPPDYPVYEEYQGEDLVEAQRDTEVDEEVVAQGGAAIAWWDIKVPIGDWSGDGHGKCDHYVVTVNRNIDQIFELHFKASEVLGFDLGSMCKDYGDNKLTEKMIDKFNEINLDHHFCNPPPHLVNAANSNYEDCPQDTRDLVHIWFAAMKFVDSNLYYSIRNENHLPTLNNWTCPNKLKQKTQKHFNNPGYGMFE